MPVILLRHTRPAVGDGVCYGRLDIDVADSFEGEMAAVLAALPPCVRIVSSPLRRCRRLAAAIATARQLAVAVDEGLAEMDFGDWEGRTWEDIGTAALDAWAADFLHFHSHGGESVAQFERRVGKALAAYARLPEVVLIVCHAGVIRSALAPDRDGPKKWDRPVPFGSLHRLEPAPC